MFVAHRLRTIYDCDQILVLKEGHVAEKGSHRDLLEQNGIYAELWNGKRPADGVPEGIGEQRKLTKSCATAQEMSLAQDLDSEPTVAEEEESSTITRK